MIHVHHMIVYAIWNFQHSKKGNLFKGVFLVMEPNILTLNEFLYWMSSYIFQWIQNTFNFVKYIPHKFVIQLVNLLWYLSDISFYLCSTYTHMSWKRKRFDRLNQIMIWFLFNDINFLNDLTSPCHFLFTVKWCSLLFLKRSVENQTLRNDPSMSKVWRFNSNINQVGYMECKIETRCFAKLHWFS